MGRYILGWSLSLFTPVTLVTLVTLFRSYNQFYRAECITVSGLFVTDIQMPWKVRIKHFKQTDTPFKEVMIFSFTYMQAPWKVIKCYKQTIRQTDLLVIQAAQLTWGPN